MEGEFWLTNLCEHEGRVMFEEDVTIADSGEGSRAAAEGALAGLLGRRVDSLPASVTFRQVGTRHPAVVPHVEVPSGKQVRVRLIEWYVSGRGNAVVLVSGRTRLSRC